MHPRPRALVSWSTGKDSAFALWRVREAGALEVVGLLTTLSPAYGRVSVHGTREALLARHGLQGVYPLWGEDTRQLAEAMVASGLRAHLTCVDPRVLPRAFAGQQFGPGFLERLPAGVDPCGENGEFHTCVVAGPMFARPLQVRPGEVVEREGFVYADLLLDADEAA